MDTISRAITKIAFWRWPKRIRELEERLSDMQQELWDAKASEQKVKVHHRTGMFKIMKWIHTTHRLDKPASGIRALLQKSGFAIAGLLLLCQSVFGQAPFQRNPFTTNPPAVSPGVSVQGLNNISITNVGSGTSWWFYAVRPQTVARLIDVTNIVGAISAGTNALVQTNGVNVGSIGTLNFNSGVTGFVSGSVVTVGVNATGGGGDQVWTNELGVIHPVSTNATFVYQNGGIAVGTNTLSVIGETISNTFGGVFFSGHDETKGEPDATVIHLGSKTSTGDAFAILRAAVNGGGTTLDMDWTDSGTHNFLQGTIDSDGPVWTGVWTNQLAFSLSARAPFGGMLYLDNFQSEGNYVLLKSNGVQRFIVNNGGDLSKIKSVSYSWPTANSAGSLTNDGLGNLFWGITGGGGTGLTTNGNQFGASVELAIKSGAVLTNINLWNTVQMENHQLFNIGTADTIVFSDGFTNIWFAPDPGANPGHGAQMAFDQLYPKDDNFFDLGNSGQRFRTIWSMTNKTAVVDITNRLSLSNVTASKIAVFDASKFLTNSTVDAGNLGYLTSQILTNFIGTGAVTNVVSLSTSNATSAPLTNAYANGVLTLFGLEGSANITLSHNGSNIVIATAGTAGEVNVNGEVSVTNSTRMGWVFDKSGVTNRLRSIQGGNGILLTNESTNIMVAIDPAVVASVSWANSISNLAETKQNGSAVLTNLVGTVSRNVTNVVSLSTTNATSKPLTNSYTAGVLTIFGMEQGSGHLLTMNASNIVTANDWVQTASTTNVVGVSNWVNAVSNYVTAATNSASVTNWINSRQPASANLTNWSLIPTGSMANVVSTTFLTNWANSISNLAETKQNGSAVLTNLVGTVARNVTNVVSLSTTNATSKPLTNSYTAGVLTIFGLEQGSGSLLTMSSNIVVANDWAQTASTTNVVGVSNWVNSVSNLTQTKQNGTLVLTNLSGTKAITNLVNASTSGVTWLGWIRSTNNGDALLKTVTGSGAITITEQGTNIDISASGLGEANVNGEVSLTNNANGIYGLVYDKVGITNRIKSIASGLNIVITNEGTNLVIASTASGSGQPASTTLTNLTLADRTNWNIFGQALLANTNGLATDYEKKAFTTGVDRANCVLFHSNMVFVGLQDGTSPKFLKFPNPGDLSTYQETNLFADGFHVTAVQMKYSQTRGKIIVLFYGSSSLTMTEIDPVTLATNDVIRNNTDVNDMFSFCHDETNLWVASYASSGSLQFCVYQFRLSDYAAVGNLESEPNLPSSGLGSQWSPIGYDITSGKLYSMNGSNGSMWGWSAPASNMSNFVSRTTVGIPFNVPGDQVEFIGNYAYFMNGGQNDPVTTGVQYLYRMSKSTLEIDRLSVGNATTNILGGMYNDGRYLWISCTTNREVGSSIARFNPVTMEIDHAILASTNNAYKITGDGTNRLFVAGKNLPGELYRYKAPIINAPAVSWIQEQLTNGPGIILSNVNDRWLQIGTPYISQGNSAVLSNLVGTVARNVTNVVSLSTTNATSKPLTNSYTSGVLTLFGLEQGANITLTPNGSNIVVASTASGGITTNANQFGSQTTLTIKEGANLTNTLFWPSNLLGPAIIATASVGQGTNLVEWRQTNGNVGLAVSSNGLSFVGLYLNHASAVAFRTNNVSLQLNMNQTFTNGLKTNMVLQITNALEGVTMNLDAYGAGRLGGVATNAWTIQCTVASGSFLYWPPGTTNGNYDVLLNSNQVVTMTFRSGLGASNILASYLVREGIGAN